MIVASYVPELYQQYSQTTSRTGDTVSPIGYNPWSCVSYVKFKRADQSEPWGSPNKVQVYDILFPFKGLIVITKEGPVGHAAYIEEVVAGMMRVSEANYIPGKYSERWIKIGDPIIRGYK